MSDSAQVTGAMTREEREYELAKLRIEHSARYVGKMIETISLIAGLISVIVVVSVVAIAIIPTFLPNVVRPEIPDVLSNWGGIILGFYFGQFINLVKDYIGVIQSSTASTEGKSAVGTSS